MVHSVRLVLAHRTIRARDISLRLAADAAVTHFWNCRSWSFELDQRAVPPSSEAATRSTRDLTRCFLPVDYRRVKAGISR